MLALIIAGEAAALIAVAAQTDNLMLRGSTPAALLYAGVLLCIYAVHGPRRPGVPAGIDLAAAADKVRIASGHDHRRPGR